MNLAAYWHYEVARFFLFVKKDERAIRALRESLALDPAFVRARESLAFLYASTGRSQLAVEEFQNALRLAPDRGVTWFNLGFVYHAQGQHEDAVSAFSKAVELS